MSIKTFLKDKLLYIIINILVATFTSLLLFVIKLNTYAICFIVGLYIVSNIIVLLIELITKQSYYNTVKASLKSLNKKCLLSELISEPSFAEGKLLYDVLKITNKSMNDEVAKYRIASEEYREYIEAWVHEVKTPIASSKLLIENNKNPTTKSIDEEIDKIYSFVEQALFYSISNGVEKDYIIREVSLKNLINIVISKNAKAFIEGKIGILVIDLDYSIYTDVKWTDFILNQLLSNAIKYKKDNERIKIYASQNPNSISLFIEDNGIGIPEKDISKVFQKGFTGENGRKYSKSTGMGLYLCKKLCDKLGLGIFIKSGQKTGTIVQIVFPKSRMTMLES